MGANKEVFDLQLVRILKENKSYRLIVDNGGIAEKTTIVRDDPLVLLRALNAFDFRSKKGWTRSVERLMDKITDVHEELWADRDEPGEQKTEIQVTAEQFEILEHVTLISPAKEFEIKGIMLKTVNHIQDIADDRKKAGKSDEKPEEGPPQE